MEHGISLLTRGQYKAITGFLVTYILVCGFGIPKQKPMISFWITYEETLKHIQTADETSIRLRDLGNSDYEKELPFKLFSEK